MSEIPIIVPHDKDDLISIYSPYTIKNLERHCVEKLKICKKDEGLNVKSRKEFFLRAIGKYHGIDCGEIIGNIPRAERSDKGRKRKPVEIPETKIEENKITTILHFSDFIFSDLENIHEHEITIKTIIQEIAKQKFPRRTTFAIITLSAPIQNSKTLYLTEEFARELYPFCGLGVKIFCNSTSFLAQDKSLFVDSQYSNDFEGVKIYFRKPVEITTKKTINISIKNERMENFDHIIGSYQADNIYYPGTSIQQNFDDTPLKHYNIYEIADKQFSVKQSKLPNPYAKVLIFAETQDKLISELQKITTEFEFPHIKITSSFPLTELQVKKFVPQASNVQIEVEKNNILTHVIEKYGNIIGENNKDKNWNLQCISINDVKTEFPNGITKIVFPNFGEIVKLVIFSDMQRINKAFNKSTLKISNYEAEIMSSTMIIKSILTIDENECNRKFISNGTIMRSMKKIPDQYKLFDLMYIPNFTIQKKPNIFEPLKIILSDIKYAPKLTEIILLMEGEINNDPTIQTKINSLEKICTEDFIIPSETIISKILEPINYSVKITNNTFHLRKDNKPINTVDVDNEKKFMILFAIRTAFIQTSQVFVPKTLIIEYPINETLERFISQYLDIWDKIIIAS